MKNVWLEQAEFIAEIVKDPLPTPGTSYIGWINFRRLDNGKVVSLQHTELEMADGSPHYGPLINNYGLKVKVTKTNKRVTDNWFKNLDGSPKVWEIHKVEIIPGDQ